MSEPVLGGWIPEKKEPQIIGEVKLSLPAQLREAGEPGRKTLSESLEQPSPLVYVPSYTSTGTGESVRKTPPTNEVLEPHQGREGSNGTISEKASGD